MIVLVFVCVFMIVFSVCLGGYKCAFIIMC